MLGNYDVLSSAFSGVNARKKAGCRMLTMASEQAGQTVYYRAAGTV
jgi:hypothetical protein